VSVFATSEELTNCPLCEAGELREYPINDEQGAIACQSCSWWILTVLTSEQRRAVRLDRAQMSD
jgi:hypothetical protein